jgi:hypothetical protein
MEIAFEAKIGSAVYTAYQREKHLRTGLLHDPRIPLLLSVDFNVSPMIWIVAQMRAGNLYIIDEIAQAPASVASMVQEFRNRYSDQLAPVEIYGDATGNSASAQTARSYYELMAIELKGYPAPIHWRVPVANPRVVNRVNAVNLWLSNPDNTGAIAIDADKCPELVADMAQVVWSQTAKKQEILKIFDPAKEYSRRTHASDALGYLIWRLRPAEGAATRMEARGRVKPRKQPKHWLGRM